MTKTPEYELTLADQKEARSAAEWNNQSGQWPYLDGLRSHPHEPPAGTAPPEAITPLYAASPDPASAQVEERKP
jgi:hypothetical protein